MTENEGAEPRYMIQEHLLSRRVRPFKRNSVYIESSKAARLARATIDEATCPPAGIIPVFLRVFAGVVDVVAAAVLHRRSIKSIDPVLLSKDEIQQDGGKYEMSAGEVDRLTAKRPHSNLVFHEMLEVRPHAQRFQLREKFIDFCATQRMRILHPLQAPVQPLVRMGGVAQRNFLQHQQHLGARFHDKKQQTAQEATNCDPASKNGACIVREDVEKDAQEKRKSIFLHGDDILDAHSGKVFRLDAAVISTKLERTRNKNSVVICILIVKVKHGGEARAVGVAWGSKIFFPGMSNLDVFPRFLLENG